TCRLRDAIAAAQPGDTVSFAVDGTIALAATLALDRDVRIDGSGRTVAIDGGGNVTVFRVASGATARIERVTIRNGRASETCAGALRCGGGIRNAGNLTLSGVTVAFNAAADIGAGVYNDGTLRLVNGTLSDNAAGDGGGLYNAGSAQIANSTFGDNIAASGAGVRNAGGGSATLVNTIVDAGCAGIVTDLGGNLDGDGSCGFATANGSMSNAAIGLGPLQDNGGATPTRLPGPTSAAIGFGRDDACAADGNVDQRGIARPQGVHCDAGATEVRLHALTASVTTSNGAVASADGRIAACTRTLGDCEAEYSAEGEGVPVVATLVVVPTAHYHLVAWGGDCAVDGTVAMSADRHCTAAFAIDLRSVGGTVTGLAGSGLDVRLNGGDAQAVTAANPAFAFAPLPDLSAWAVTVAAQPVSPWQTCAVDPATASGTLDGADVTDVAVHCTTNAYTVGGTVAGFAHADTPLVLRLDADGAQTASVASGQAGFAFAASVASGTAYVVSIAQQPQGHVCAIDAGASGTVHGENIADVRVTCVRLPRLALAIADGGDYARYDSVPAYLVRLTNTGGATQDVAIAATLSPAFDSDAASWVCDAGTLGATCTPFGNGPLADTVRLPADSDLVFVLGAPLRAMTPETTATVTVGATGAAPVSDVDTLVIFRDGFEPP
ncbi:MAG TPA: right-handed parallel beta-helix repeat-containing protein, partial [Tahibacter sp.]|nr:right-handed parallel beta-helix repeat-containing protein [Tahibacter sp.]